MSLSSYRAKRDPSATPEPMGEASHADASTSLRFVIQEHHARALHWDFRLERDGVMCSWALPKGVPIWPKQNRLAVQTEDHPIEYANFEGEIPRGQYGGGSVTIWDAGTYECEKWNEREVAVTLHGSRAIGRFVLFRTGGKNWMIHRKDPPEDMEPMPEVIAPMLALSGSLPKDEEHWAYEFKWDGVRAMLYVDGGRVPALSRNEKDLTASFPELAEIGLFLGSTQAVLDAEIVALDEGGRPSFSRMQHRLHLVGAAQIARRAKEYPVSTLVFDLVYLDGHVLTDLSYDDRRSLLEALGLQGEHFATPPSLRDTKGDDVLEVSRERGLEGVVAKRRDARYAPGKRNGQWIKVKNFKTQEIVIGGFTVGKGAHAGSLGALLCGVNTKDGLSYVGRVGTGFSASDRRELWSALVALEQKATPFSAPLSTADAKGARFVTPSLVGEVQYGEWTPEGSLRHPSWRGLRPDKDPSEVTRES